MDQIYQLQRQLQDLQQEVSTINQVAGQLQRSEANHAAQLQQISQSENVATQQLQTIQQLCNRLNQDVNYISSSIAQQLPQMAIQASSMNQMGTGQLRSYSPMPSTGQYSPAGYGTYGAQFGGNRTDEFTRNQQISQMAANRYGLGFTGNDFTTNQQLSNMANQGMLGTQTNLGMSSYGSSMGMGLPQSGYASTSAGNYMVQPSHPVSYMHPTMQYGTGTYTGNLYTPSFSSGQFSTAGQIGSGIPSQSFMGLGGQQIGRYSNF